MSNEDKPFKVRLGEKDDFDRWSRLTSATIHSDGPYQLFLSQPSGMFTAQFVPPDYLIDGLLQRRFCYALTAPTGAGKTAIALLLAAFVALGRSIGNRKISPGRVLYFAGENPDDVRMRWIAMAEHVGFDRNNITVRFVAGSFKLAELNARVTQEVEALGGAELVIIDTSAAYFGGSEENSNVEMGNYARIIRGLTTLEGGPTVIALCHPPKGATNDNLQPRGGGAFVAEVDGNLTCVKNDVLVTLHWQTKFRGPDFEPLVFELCPVTADAVRDSEDRLIPTIIVKLVDERRQEAIRATVRSEEDAVLIAISNLEDAPSIAGLCTYLGWLTKDGNPQKSKAHRVVERLRKAKLVKADRDGVALTDEGKKAAKKASTNQTNTGAKYG